MFSDPQSITPTGGSAQSMPRIQQAGLSSTYQTADSNYVLVISHQTRKAKGKSRVSSLAKFTQRAIVPDPLTSVNDYETVSVHVVIDRPEAGFTATQIDALVQGFKAWLTTTVVTNMVGLQS